MQISKHEHEQRSTFLDALWPAGLPAGHYFNLWTPPGASFWHTDIQRAINDARLVARDAYFGVGVGITPHDRSHRFLQHQIEALPAVFVDFDFKSGLTMDSVDEFCAKTLPYSIKVYTGGGVHLYWLLDKPLLGHDAIASYLGGWKNYVKTLPHGKLIDTLIIEPSRVLRLPGSVNYKYDPPRQVALEFCYPNVRYSHEELPTLERVVTDHTQKEFYTAPNSGFTEGQRNWNLYRWCSSLLRVLGATDVEHICQLALTHNSFVNSPPLDEKEVRLAAGSAWKKWMEKNHGGFLTQQEDNGAIDDLARRLSGN